MLCFVADCEHYSHKNACAFFRFPTDARMKKKWINIIGRADVNPGPSARVCSCHFVDGDRKNLPSIFTRNAKKRLDFKSPEKRKRRTEKQGPKNVAAVTTTTSELQPHTDPDGQLDASAVGEQGASTNVHPSTSKEIEQDEVQKLRHLVEYLTLENQQLASKYDKLMKESLNWEQMRRNEQSILFHTGLPTAKIFETVLSLFDDIEINYYYGWTVEKIDRPNQLLITLMKLRQNMPRYDLALFFHCSVATISNIVTTWIYLLHTVLFKELMKEIPSINKNQACLPACFTDYSNCRIIIDCTEVSTAVRKEIKAQRLTYSAYKHRNTMKALVGIAPNGVITFASRLFPGSTSDKEIVQHCGLLSHLKPGDVVMADKGFLIKDLLPEGVSFNIPPFLSSPQFTPSQVNATKSIARARIHVERAIRRIKTFKILQMIPVALREHASVIFQTCAALTNLQYPLIKEVEHLYYSTD